jgi:hypothetical protein
VQGAWPYGASTSALRRSATVPSCAGWALSWQCSRSLINRAGPPAASRLQPAAARAAGRPWAAAACPGARAGACIRRRRPPRPGEHVRVCMHARSSRPRRGLRAPAEPVHLRARSRSPRQQGPPGPPASPDGRHPPFMRRMTPWAFVGGPLGRIPRMTGHDRGHWPAFGALRNLARPAPGATPTPDEPMRAQGAAPVTDGVQNHVREATIFGEGSCAALCLQLRVRRGARA